MKIIIETKEELEQYEEYKTLNEVEQAESIFHDKDVKIDGSLVAEEGECQQYIQVYDYGTYHNSNRISNLTGGSSVTSLRLGMCIHISEDWERQKTDEGRTR